jgi:hypothetical protein
MTVFCSHRVLPFPRTRVAHACMHGGGGRAHVHSRSEHQAPLPSTAHVDVDDLLLPPLTPPLSNTRPTTVAAVSVSASASTPTAHPWTPRVTSAAAEAGDSDGDGEEPVSAPNTIVNVFPVWTGVTPENLSSVVLSMFVVTLGVIAWQLGTDFYYLIVLGQNLLPG